MTYKDLAQYFVKELMEPEVSPETIDKVYREVREGKEWEQLSQEMKTLVHKSICMSMKAKLKALGRWDINTEPLAWNYIPGSRPLTEEELRFVESVPDTEIPIVWVKKTAPQQSHRAEEVTR